MSAASFPARRVGRREVFDVLAVEGRVIGHVPQCDGDARHVLEGEPLAAQSFWQCNESKILLEKCPRRSPSK